MTLEDPDKVLAVVDTLITPTSSASSLPPDLLLSDNNLLSFDVCKLSSMMISKLNDICFGSA